MNIKQLTNFYVAFYVPKFRSVDVVVMILLGCACMGTDGLKRRIPVG